MLLTSSTVNKSSSLLGAPIYSARLVKYSLLRAAARVALILVGKGRYDEWPECRMVILEFLAGMTNGRYDEWPQCRKLEIE